MPLTRYQIRNEYSLADPELYRAADRDDPEALLEGVAMAGLVGVLRQLGDLAEFAAEIFHDLHEEVMATSARGHGLMIRVQQLEAEFPSIEKAFLSQTNHTPFFSNTGIEWHPNLRMEQNLITRGDLPRCVMDSYEECRGPPRLFLLDKFDVAGAGACLKRYTDPSIFKLEPASSEIPSVEGQREKKIRKVKKKGSRWRNGETPEIAPTSHAKLHQLFLEERVEKGQSDPARLVKLKKRQLNASPFDTRSGKSYMEKFLDSSPESNVVRDISVNLLPLKLMSDNSSESGLEIYDINTVSPVKKSSQAKESICSSPNAQEEVLKPSMEELYGEVFDRQIVEIPQPIADGETDEVLPPVVHKVTLEKEIAVDGEGKTEASIDGDQSDDMTSEVDSYMDALATMESEMETDNEYRLKTDTGFSNVKHVTDSDRNEEPLEFEANYSDSQSVGNFSTADEGNPSFKKEKSSVSYSDTHNNLAENTPSDGEGGAKVSPSLGTFVAEIKDTPSDQLPANMEIQGAKSHDLLLPTDKCIDEDNTPDHRESSFNSSSMDSNPTLLPSDPEISSLQNKLNGTPSESMKSGYELSNADETETHLVNSSAVVSDMPLQVRDDIHFEVCAESQPIDDMEGGDPNVSSDGLLHVSNNLELAPEKKISAHSEYKVLQTDLAGENSAENVVDKRIGSPKSVTSTVEEQFHCSTTPNVEVDSGSTSLLDGSDVVKHTDSASEVDDTFPATEVYLENSTTMENSTEVHLENSTSQTVSFEDQEISDISDSAQEVEPDSTEKAALSSEEEAKPEDISRIADSEKVDASTCKVDAVEGGAVSLELPSNVPDVSFVEDHVGLHDAAAENVIATEIMAVSASSVAAPSDDFPPSISADDDINDIVCSSPDIICSPSSDPANMQESHSGIEDSNQEELDINEPVSPECARRSEADSQLDVASKDLDSASCKLVSYEDSNLEMVDGVHNSSLANTNQNSLPAGNVVIVPASSESSDLELVLKYHPHQSILLEDREDATSSPTGNLPDPDSSLEKWQADQRDVENLRAVESSSKSSNHLSEQVQSPNHSDQGRCFNDASVSCQEDLPSQPSPSVYVPQSTGNEINGTEQATDPRSTTALPNFGLPNGGTQVNLEDMPPLPPLPPMQWRLGKFQHAPLFFQRGVIEHSQESFPSMLPFRDDEKVQISFQAPQRGILQSGNPFLPLAAFEVEESHASEQVAGNELQPTSSSLQLPAMVNGANSQPNSLAFEETQYLNPFLTLSALPIEKPEYSFIASEGEMVQSSSNPFLPGPSVENIASRHDSDASQGKLIHPLNQSVSEAALEDNALQCTSQNSEGEHRNTSNTSILPPIKVDEQPQHGLPTSERESPRSSTSFALQHTSQNSEEENQNPSNTSVLPPRKVDEQPQHDLPNSESESSCPSNPFALQHTTQNSEEEQRNPSNTSVLPPRKVDEQHQHGLPTSESESSWSSNPFSLQHTTQNSEEEHQNPSNTSILPSRKVDEEPQYGLPTSERESSWSSNRFAFLPTAEVGKANGGSITKLPRPRNPLFDVVAALDKSKLRKVTERDRPQNALKADERDSLLEQIRTKSFNLKPAVVTRPSIQGPTTNLKVAAILQKANAIRQVSLSLSLSLSLSVLIFPH
ncbi:hypothetical protein Dsin_007289 [Dipteronia sinensis]|uniref:Protein SCAR n=1 Tax=Dipteronia sinensis TaxID=43782 RepID=A0AAE0B151_9ROSI|nr:hypothetical protein Dsin_007289 [Dipteronia sinensis]